MLYYWVNKEVEDLEGDSPEVWINHESTLAYWPDLRVVFTSDRNDKFCQNVRFEAPQLYQATANEGKGVLDIIVSEEPKTAKELVKILEDTEGFQQRSFEEGN